MSKSSFCCLISLLLIFILVVPGFGQTRVGKLGVGVDGSMQYVFGAGSVTTSPAIGYGLNMSYSMMEGLSLRSKIAVNQLSWETTPVKKSITTDLMSLSGYLSIDLMPNSSFNIFLLGGGALAFYDPKTAEGGREVGASSSDIHFIGGLGADLFLSEFWSITMMGEYVLTNSQYYNGPVNSSSDSFLRGSIQIRYYFFDQSFITKLLETQRERSNRNK
jgi:hypothetical protein